MEELSGGAGRGRGNHITQKESCAAAGSHSHLQSTTIVIEIEKNKASRPYCTLLFLLLRLFCRQTELPSFLPSFLLLSDDHQLLSPK
jgi:hypothetical protein